MHGTAVIGGRGACILLVTLATAAALFLGRPVGSSPATYRLCGKKLADLLSLVCKDRGYYDPFAPKPAYARGESYRENKIGVSDECCRTGCTEATLKSYCAPSEDDYGDPDLPRDEQPSGVSVRRPEQVQEGDARVPPATKVSRGGKRRQGEKVPLQEAATKVSGAVPRHTRHESIKSQMWEVRSTNRVLPSCCVKQMLL